MAAQDPTYTALQAAVQNLAETTGLIIKLGYIGNVWRWGDDRSWRIFVEGIRDRHNNNLLSYGSFGTEDLDSLLAGVEAGKIQERIRWAFDRQDLWFFTNVKDVWLETVMTAAEVEAAVREVAGA